MIKPHVNIGPDEWGNNRIGGKAARAEQKRLIKERDDE